MNAHFLEFSLIQNDIRTINYQLWLVLILTSFIPLIYSTTRIHFLGSIPSPWTFSIAAQAAWLNVGYEVINEALLLPLAFILGSVVTDERRFRERANISLSIIIASYLVVTAYVVFYAPYLVKVMQQKAELIIDTVNYIRLESIAIFLSSIYSFLSLILILKNEKNILYTLLIVQVILTVLCDSVLVSQLPISLELGVNGIAISNTFVNSILAIIAINHLKNSGFNFKFERSIWGQTKWLKDWLAIGWKSGLESLVRNTAFIVMALQLINQVQQAGIFWLTNQFIWGWLLLPVLALGQLVKQDAATNKGLSATRVNSYLWITVGITIIWAISIPVWDSFISNIMGVAESSKVIGLAYLLLGFYVAFSFNNVIDSYFYGIGRTDLMLYQSLIVNIIFYGSAFICYQAGVFVPTLETIAMMFGLGLTVDAIITWGLYRILRNKLNLTQ